MAYSSIKVEPERGYDYLDVFREKTPGKMKG